MTPPEAERAFHLGAIRTTASHTIGISHLVELLKAVPADAPHEAYRSAVVDENVLGRPTEAGRKRSFRHLRELYHLDPSLPEFRAMRVLWDVDPTSRPLLAGTLAFTRDVILRASFAAVADATPGSVVASDDLTKAVAAELGSGLSVSTLGKTGRNTGACWTQTGHLVGRTRKVRQRVAATPVAVTFAAYLGFLSGKRGARVVETPWLPLLEVRPDAAMQLLRDAHGQGLVTVMTAGNVVDVSFPQLEEAHQ